MYQDHPYAVCNEFRRYSSLDDSGDNIYVCKRFEDAYLLCIRQTEHRVLYVKSLEDARREFEETGKADVIEETRDLLIQYRYWISSSNTVRRRRQCYFPPVRHPVRVQLDIKVKIHDMDVLVLPLFLADPEVLEISRDQWPKSLRKALEHQSIRTIINMPDSELVKRFSKAGDILSLEDLAMPEEPQEIWTGRKGYKNDLYFDKVELRLLENL